MTTTELPGGWTSAPLADVVVGDAPILYGILQPGPNLENGIPYVRPTEISDDKIQLNQLRKTSEKIAAKYSRSILAEGDIIMSMVGTIGKVALVPASLVGGNITQSSVRIRAEIRLIDRLYLAWFLRSPLMLRQFGASQLGTAVPRLNVGDIRLLDVSLPPLAEQKRIVAKIEELFSELDAGEESLRRARHQLGVYRQSLLKQAFEGKLTAQWRAQHPDLLESPDQLLARIQEEREARYEEKLEAWEAAVAEWECTGKLGAKPKKPRKPKDPIEIEAETLAALPALPAQWAWVSLGELADTTVGFAFKSKEFRQSGVRLLRGDNIEPRALRWTNAMHWAEDDLDDYTDLLVNEGDIILAMDRPVISSGLKVALARAHDVPCLLVQRVARITGVEGVENRFLLALIDQQRFINHCLGHQTGTQLPHISEGQIRAYAVPLFSLPEQQEIVRLLDEQFEVIEQNEREIDAALKRSEALRQAILKKAFTGQLVPQDPTDEPAAELLSRIREEREESDRMKPAAKKRTTKKARQ